MSIDLSGIMGHHGKKKKAQGINNNVNGCSEEQSPESGVVHVALV